MYSAYIKHKCLIVYSYTWPWNVYITSYIDI